jgi:hypothetical protein
MVVSSRPAETVDGQGDGQRAEQDAGGVRRVELGRVQRRHPHALVRLRGDQPFLLEHPQHLAQRRAAHAQLLGQRRLGQLGARGEPAVEDGGPQVGVQRRHRLPGGRQVDPLDAREPDDALRHWGPVYDVATGR